MENSVWASSWLGFQILSLFLLLRNQWSPSVLQTIAQQVVSDASDDLRRGERLEPREAIEVRPINVCNSNDDR